MVSVQWPEKGLRVEDKLQDRNRDWGRKNYYTHSLQVKLVFIPAGVLSPAYWMEH